MFKKNVWIVGLLAALAIMFAGCVDALVEDDSGVEITVTDLQAIIKDVPVQVLNEDKWNAIFDDTPFKMCGESAGKFEIIEVGGKKALKVSQMTANWGVGFDARSATNPSAHVKGINFKAGDVITIKGSTDLADGITLNAKGENGMAKLSNWSGTGNFETAITVTSAEATEIKANSAKGSLRIHGGGDSGPGRMGTIILEEFKVVGKRGAGDVDPPPLTYNIDGAGDYMKPADQGLEYYLDLGLAVYSQLNPNKFPTAKITEKDLTVTYDTNTQGVFVPFTSELKRIILTAKTLGYNFAISVDGELSNYYSINQIRMGFANDGGSDWNATDLPVFNAAANFNTNRTLTANVNFTVAKTNGIIIQARPGAIVTDTSGVDSWSGGNDVGPFTSDGTADRSKIVTYKLTIKSIKVVISGTPTSPAALDEIDIELDKPRAGAKAQTTVSGANFSGTVSWSPALPEDGKFERSQIYSAVIALTADYGYAIDIAPDVKINTDDIGEIGGTYNPGNQTVSVTFKRTQPFYELGLGVIFKLSDYIKDRGPDDLGSILQNAGGGGAKISADGVTQTNVTANWHGIDIVLGEIDVGINPALDKVKVEITGKVLTGASGNSQMRVASAGSPYTNPCEGSAYENYSANDLSDGDEFTVKINTIVSNYVSAGNQGSLRICANDDGGLDIPTSFIVTEIIITNLGAR